METIVRNTLVIFADIEFDVNFINFLPKQIANIEKIIKVQMLPANEADLTASDIINDFDSGVDAFIIPELYNGNIIFKSNILIHRGKYVTLIETDKGLHISLTLEGYEELIELEKLDISCTNKWINLLDDILCNSEFNYVDGDDNPFGDLTSSPIITHGCDREEDSNELVWVEGESKRWWFPDYMVIDEFQTLLDKGEIYFSAAK